MLSKIPPFHYLNDDDGFLERSVLEERFSSNNEDYLARYTNSTLMLTL